MSNSVDEQATKNVKAFNNLQLVVSNINSRYNHLMVYSNGDTDGDDLIRYDDDDMKVYNSEDKVVIDFVEMKQESYNEIYDLIKELIIVLEEDDDIKLFYREL